MQEPWRTDWPSAAYATGCAASSSRAKLHWRRSMRPGSAPRLGSARRRCSTVARRSPRLSCGTMDSPWPCAVEAPSVSAETEASERKLGLRMPEAPVPLSHAIVRPNSGIAPPSGSVAS